MKALILNSGMGTRMGVLTSDHPKCMTEVYGTETILSRQLKQLKEYGITDVIITTGPHDAVLQSYVRSLGTRLNITFVQNTDYQNTNYIWSIYLAREWLDDDLILMHGDLVFENSVLDELLQADESSMAVSSTLSLPEKDFKAVIRINRIQMIGIEYFDHALAAQPLYKLKREDWKQWLKQITEYCESGDISKRRCYAENAFNEISDTCHIAPLDIKDMLCNEIDTPEDLATVTTLLRKVEERTVYVSFSTDVIHSGHIALIRRARRLGKLIVGVISDEVVAGYKRYPMLPFEERKTLFQNISGVWQVTEQRTLSYKENIEKYQPAFIIHGDDWKEGFQKPIRDEVVELLASYGGRLIEFPYANDPKYKNIERRIGTEERMLYIEHHYEVMDTYLSDNHIKNMMLVHGKSAEHHPLYQHIRSLEQTADIRMVPFSDFEPNPKYESVTNAVRVFNENGCDSILAIGGGSAIDVAKCIKLFATMDHEKNYLEQWIEENNIPLMVIPTTAGTGSEVTRYAVVYYNGIKQSVTHESCIPTMVFTDPSFLETVPPYHRKATMLDALCHSVESFWSVNATEASKAYARDAIELILSNREAYLSNKREGNINMQRASQLAGRAINITQTTAGHAMCYMLTSLYGIAHGHAAALCVNALWPYLLEHTADCTDRRGEKYLIQTLRELATAFDCDTPKEAAERFSAVLAEMDFESIGEAAVLPEKPMPDDLEKLVATVKPERLFNHPILLEKETIRIMYKVIMNKSQQTAK